MHFLTSKLSNKCLERRECSQQTCSHAFHFQWQTETEAGEQTNKQTAISKSSLSIARSGGLDTLPTATALSTGSFNCPLSECAIVRSATATASNDPLRYASISGCMVQEQPRCTHIPRMHQEVRTPNESVQKCQLPCTSTLNSGVSRT